MSATAVDDQKFLESVRTTLFVTGIISLIFGLLISFKPEGTAVALVALLAIYTIAVGVFNLYLAVTGKGDLKASTRWGYAALGVLYAAAGIWLLVMDFTKQDVTTASAALTIGILFGIVWLVQGIATLFSADKGPWVIVFAILSIIAGITMLIQPLFSGVFLWIFLGIWLIVIGVVQIFRGIFFKNTVNAYEKAQAREQEREEEQVVKAAKQAVKNATK